MDIIKFKTDPVQVADPTHPYHKKWLVESEETHQADETIHGIKLNYNTFMFLTKDLEPVFWDQLSLSEKHRIYFNSEGDAIVAIADYGLIHMNKAQPQSSKTVVKSEELFDD